MPGNLMVQLQRREKREKQHETKGRRIKDKVTEDKEDD
jgi:hypothetical protein